MALGAGAAHAQSGKGERSPGFYLLAGWTGSAGGLEPGCATSLYRINCTSTASQDPTIGFGFQASPQYGMEFLSLQRDVVVGGRTYSHSSIWYLNIGYFQVAPYLTIDTLGGWLFVDIAWPDAVYYEGSTVVGTGLTYVQNDLGLTLRMTRSLDFPGADLDMTLAFRYDF